MATAEEKAADQKEEADKALAKGKLQRYVCIDDCYWESNRYRPGDVQDFQGAPPGTFPQHHFERI